MSVDRNRGEAPGAFGTTWLHWQIRAPPRGPALRRRRYLAITFDFVAGFFFAVGFLPAWDGRGVP